jgi:hypothetical protein
MKKDPQRALEVLIFLGVVSLVLGLGKLMVSGTTNRQPQEPRIEQQTDEGRQDNAEPKRKAE